MSYAGGVIRIIVDWCINSYYASGYESGKKDPLIINLLADDYVSATQNYGVTSGATFTIPFEYTHASISITQATAGYAYITINGGNKQGVYGSVQTIDGVTGMTSISICAGTGFQAHYKCTATVTFYFE